mmetsp:Transcript_22619/g.49383  ORF Transcript_22619/g.49383 Transcript_22619/m.49383 type:complete len:244 (-) Transcript_22619:175-906(-)|eukprot:CAMPEP_0168750374 /NCGR_PEP_ID=MMETSP0724-20121128/17235_1 /TAXON_ID=265536 /ORGANISM="Amphiprora sp., Strain CCMP467" /LENGTH=243 /DNA_ID=CAMNT_0008798385 /DNA_START=186 /DNA_END=917 /DNA_ORIENTATION=-
MARPVEEDPPTGTSDGGKSSWSTSAWSFVQEILDPQPEAPANGTANKEVKKKNEVKEPSNETKDAEKGQKKGFWAEMLESRRRKKDSEKIQNCFSDEAVADKEEQQHGCLQELFDPQPYATSPAGTNSTTSTSDTAQEGDWLDVDSCGCLSEILNPTPDTPSTKPTPSANESKGGDEDGGLTVNRFIEKQESKSKDDEAAKKKEQAKDAKTKEANNDQTKGRRNPLRRLFRRRKSPDQPLPAA